MNRTPPKIPRPWSVPVVSSPAISRLGERPEAAAVEEFWRTTGATMPLVEPSDVPGRAIVTFCWRDAEAERILLFANRLTDETDLDASLLRRIAGADIWHVSYELSTQWRASYAFIPQYPHQPLPWLGDNDQVAIRAALDRGLPDPLNPATCRNRAGVRQSVVALPDAPAQPWLEPGESRREGTVREVEAPGGRRAWLYEPSGGGTDLPVVVALDGDVWTSTQSLSTTLDNLIAAGRIPPVCAVMLDAGDRSVRWSELTSGGGIDDYIARELLPWARTQLDLTDDPEQVVVAGQSLGALTALRTGLRHPDAVGLVLAQSASLWSDDLDALVPSGEGPRVYLEVGTMEWVLADPHRQLARTMTERGLDVHLAEYVGGHDYACWRGGVADGLIWLLGTRS